MLPPITLTTLRQSFGSPNDSILSLAILLIALLLSAYVLYRRYHSRQLLMQRVAELEALGMAGRTIVGAELDVNALCQLIAHESGQVIDNSTFQVGIFDGVFYHILYWTIDGRIQPVPQIFNISQNDGVVGWIRTSRQPLLVRDFQREMDRLPARPRYISDSPPRSALFIPMISGEAVIGIVAAQSAQPNRFNDNDLRRLQILANQAAAAIASARLYEQERQRAAHLELVVKIAREVNAINDLDDIFDQVVQRTRETFGFHPVSIFGIEPETQDAVVEASSLPELSSLGVRIKPGVGLIGTAVSSRQITLSNNTPDDDRFLHHIGHVTHHEAANTRAEAVLPLVVDNQLLGVLDVQSPQPGAFGPAEMTVLEALAATVAVAIHKTQQFNRQQEQAWSSTVQFQIADAIGRSNDVEQMATAVTRLVPMLLGTPICALLLRDRDTEMYYTGTAVHGLPPQKTQSFRQRRLYTGDWTSLDAVEVGQTTLPATQWPTWLRPGRSQPPGELQLWPLKTKTNQLGVLVAACPPHDNDPETQRRLRMRQELLGNITDQISQALERSFLRQALQEEGWVNTALLQVAEAVNSLMDLNEILNTIVRLVPMLVGVESAVILVWNEAKKIYEIGSSYGISTMGRGLLETLQIEANEFSLTALMPTDTHSPGTTVYAIHAPPWLERVMGTKTAHAFPLIAGGQQVGAMLVGAATTQGQVFSGRRLSILNGIAQQAATAVVNSQLYAEAAERSRLAQELSVAHEIQSSLLPTHNPDIPGFTVASYWQAARQVSGDFYDFMQLDGGRWGIVVADVADKGIPAALFMALCRTILRTVAFSRRDPAETLMRVNELIDTDAQSDLFVTACYAIWDPETEVLTYANGGHNPPLLLRANGKLRLLSGHGMALGVLPRIQLKTQSLALAPGDTLIFYTDGVTEAMNEDFDEFGLERLRLAARSAAARDAGDIQAAIISAIGSHAGETAQFDDITLVVLKRNLNES